MKSYFIIIFIISLGIGNVFSYGISEYKGQNYFGGIGTSGMALQYANHGFDKEYLYYFNEHNIINDNKFFFVDMGAENFDIIRKITRDGYIKHGEKIDVITIINGVPFYIIENEDGKQERRYVDFECIYYGKTIFYNKNDEDDFFITVIGYATNQKKIIITDIFLTEEDLDEKSGEFKHIE
jgi:hypothetical protein